MTRYKPIFLLAELKQLKHFPFLKLMQLHRQICFNQRNIKFQGNAEKKMYKKIRLRTLGMVYVLHISQFIINEIEKSGRIERGLCSGVAV